MTVATDLSEEAVRMLDRLSERSHLSREELLRRAVETYVEAHRAEATAEVQGQTAAEKLAPLFGIWKDRNIDGLEYERALRDEWPD